MRLPCLLLAASVIACSDNGVGPAADAGIDTDGGPQFTAVEIPSLADPKPNFFAVWGTSDRDVFLVGERGTIVHWDGTAWTQQPTPSTADLRGVWGRATMPDMPADDVYAVGNGGAVLHYSGGVWSAEASTTSEDLHAIDGGAGKLWAVGVNGVIASKDLDDPQAIWILETSPTFETLNGLWIRGDQGAAVGNLGTILRLEGGSWSRQRIAGLTVPLQGVWGVAPDRLWITGLDGLLLRSTGTDFEEITGAPRIYLRKVVGLDYGEVYFTGWGGTIGRATGDGAEALDAFSQYRLEGIWATTYQIPDPMVDGGFLTLPRYYVVGVTGTVLIGP